MTDVAISTIAASVFSMVNVQGSTAVGQIRQQLACQGFDCEDAPLQEAIKALLNRRLVELDGDVLRGRFSGWVVAIRNREDGTGWQGWTMKRLSTGEHKLLAELELGR